MRGELKRKLRSANLRLLNKSHTYEQMADVAGVNATYLSQIANEHIGKGRKSPRSLSDNYAEKIEQGLGLQSGWFDQDHVSADTNAADSTDSALPLGLSELQPVTGDNIRLQTFIPKACPRISTISAGPWMDIADNHPPGFGDGIDYCPVPCSDGTVSFVVSGDSMTAQFGPDTFPHGTTIFVDPNVQAETGSFVIAKVNGSADVTFKQLISDGGKPMLKPLNPQYRIIEVEFRVLGVVIASQRTHR